VFLVALRQAIEVFPDVEVSMTIIKFWYVPQWGFLWVPDNHIAVVLRNPAMFGFTFEELRDRFRAHGEKIGLEGRARREILVELMGRGYHRLRKEYNGNYTMNASLWCDPVKRAAHAFSSSVLEGAGFQVFVNCEAAGTVDYREKDPGALLHVKDFHSGELLSAQSLGQWKCGSGSTHEIARSL